MESYLFLNFHTPRLITLHFTTLQLAVKLYRRVIMSVSYPFLYTPTICSYTLFLRSFRGQCHIAHPCKTFSIFLHLPYIRVVNCIFFGLGTILSFKTPVYFIISALPCSQSAISFFFVELRSLIVRYSDCCSFKGNDSVSARRFRIAVSVHLSLSKVAVCFNSADRSRCADIDAGCVTERFVALMVSGQSMFFGSFGSSFVD